MCSCARVKGQAKVGSGSHKRYRPAGGEMRKRKWFSRKGPALQSYNIRRNRNHIHICVCIYICVLYYTFILYYVYTLLQVYKAYINMSSSSYTLSPVNSMSPLCRSAIGVRQKSLNSDTVTTASRWRRVLILYIMYIKYDIYSKRFNTKLPLNSSHAHIILCII